MRRRAQLQSAEDGTPLSLGVRAALEPLVRSYRPGFSEYSFSNLYLFRNVHDYRYHCGPRPFLSGRTYDGRPHIMPLFDWRAESADLVDLARERRAIIYPVAEADRLGSRVKITENEADADYIYSALSLATYSGAELKPKRQLASTFERLAEPALEAAERVAANDLALVLDGWLNDVSRPLGATDYETCRAAIELRGELGLFGLLVRSRSGQPLAFVLASEVADGMAAIHFAKARRKIPGALPFLFRAFARRYGTTYPLLNFEQDLGSPGFRQNKRSFAPMRLARKLRIEPI